MNKFTCSLVLLALLGLGLVPSSANAVAKVVVYWDAALTQRAIDSPGIGQVSTAYIAGEDFPAAFISGIQYAVDYGPNLNWLADTNLPPVALGSSPNGISIGFGAQPRPGKSFLIQTVLVMWTSECSNATLNSAYPDVGEHPLFPDPTPVATRFPDFDVIPALGIASSTCPWLDLAVRPSHQEGNDCRIPMNTLLWVGNDGGVGLGGVLPITIVGTPFADDGRNSFNVDVGSVQLNGVGPLWNNASGEEDEVGYVIDPEAARAAADLMDCEYCPERVKRPPTRSRGLRPADTYGPIHRRDGVCTGRVGHCGRRFGQVRAR
jgi:hypothetical protein